MGLLQFFYANHTNTCTLIGKIRFKITANGQLREEELKFRLERTFTVTIVTGRKCVCQLFYCKQFIQCFKLNFLW